MKKLLTSFFVLFLAISLSAQNEVVPLQVGDTVIVKQEAKRYLTGERISSWVYTVKHTIRQIGTAKWQDGVLLRGIRSWLAPSDVSPIGITPQQPEKLDTLVVETEEQSVVEPQPELVVEQQPEPAAPIAQATPYAGPIRLYGRLVAHGSNTNISGATITLANQNLSTTTNQNGEFTLLYLEPGDEELIIEADGYNADIQLIQILAQQDNDLGALYLQPNMAKEVKDEMLLNLADQDMNDDEGRSQEMNASLSSSVDIFNSVTSFAWSSARYRNRGYDSKEEINYIEGLSFNAAERGQFNFSAMGGLNDASRYKETNNPLEATNFTFGGIGKSTNYLMAAHNYAHGWKVGAAGTNRNYKAALRTSYSSGPLANGWTFMGQLALRFGPYTQQKGQIGEGIDYYSFGYFFTAEKTWGTRHRLSLLTFGSPTRRGQSGAVTDEVYNLTNLYNKDKYGCRWGANNYNPYWGYQNGKMRNSRIVKSYDPTLVAAYDFKIDDNQTLHVALGGHYSFYSNSALQFYNAPDPRPDYYRNLPSFLRDGQIDEEGYFISKNINGTKLGNGYYDGLGQWVGPSIDRASYESMFNAWATRDPQATQIDWDQIYAANYANNAVNKNASARYIVERRHNDIAEVNAAANYRNTQFDHLTMTAGLELKESVGIHYKTIDDLLGGNQWIDIDPFAERDIKELATNIGLTQTDIEMVKQNDMAHRDKRTVEGERFGYDYQLLMTNAKAWFQNEWQWHDIDLYYALQLTYSSLQRNTNMLNGRAWYLTRLYQRENPGYEDYFAQIYLGKNGIENAKNILQSKYYGWGHHFIDPAFKLGLTYKINGRNRIKFNALAMTKAPLGRDAYLSPRIHDRAIASIYTHDNARNLVDYYAASEKIVGGDLTYEFNFPIVSGRVTGFYTRFWNGTELNGYYDDEARTFVNQAMTGIDRRHCGVEAAISVKMGTYLTLTGAASMGDYSYTDNAQVVTSAENGMALGETKRGPVFELADKALIKGLKVASGPQANASLKLSFFHPDMWFADVTVSYFDWNWLDYAPSRRMESLYTGKCYDTNGNEVSANGGYYQVYTSRDKFIDATKDENGNSFGCDKYGTPKLRYPYNMLADQESLVDGKVWNRFMIDASLGKLIYLKNRSSLSINLSVSNLTNNTHFKTGGYQQARLPRSTRQGYTDAQGNSTINANVWKFPSKYYYAWGTNFYLNIQYKF